MPSAKEPFLEGLTDAQRTAIDQIIRQQGEEYLASCAVLDANRAMEHFAKDDFSYVGHGTQSFVYPSYEAFSDHLHDVSSRLREAQLRITRSRASRKCVPKPELGNEVT